MATNGVSGCGENSNPITAEHVYKVRKGDTLGIIAKATGLSIEHLANCNGIKDVNKLEIGQELKLHYHSDRPLPGFVADMSDPDEYEDMRVDGINAFMYTQRFYDVESEGAREYLKKRGIDTKF